MIFNNKTYFDKKVTICRFGAIVTVKQPSSFLNICMFKIKSNLKTFLIFKNDTKTCAIPNLYSSKYYREKS